MPVRAFKARNGYWGEYLKSKMCFKKVQTLIVNITFLYFLDVHSGQISENATEPALWLKEIEILLCRYNLFKKIGWRRVMGKSTWPLQETSWRETDYGTFTSGSRSIFATLFHFLLDLSFHLMCAPVLSRKTFSYVEKEREV